jgi:phytanoyl-CoA hydroxylase
MTPSTTERRQLDEAGFFVRDRVLGRAECDALCDRLSERIHEVAADYLARRRTEWDFWRLLLRSAHGLEAFFDGVAGPPLDRPAEEWETLVTRVGHGLHRADGRFGEVATSPPIADVMRTCIPAPVHIAQSAVVYKQPRNETVQFGWHQDAWYISVEPDTLMLAFVALDDMDAANGALMVAPGSHRDGLYERCAVGPNGWEPLQPPRRFIPRNPMLLAMERGSVAFLHGRCFHASDPNRSDRPRRSFIVHAFGGGSRLMPGCWIDAAPPGGFTALPPSGTA